MMRVISLLMGVVAALSYGVTSAQAQQFEPPPDQTPAATIEYDGKKSAALQYGDISLTIDSKPISGGPERVPVAAGRYKGQIAFTIRPSDDSAREEPTATVSLIVIDPSSPAPQVVLSYFTGGAHCCVLTRIATLDKAGQWHIVDAGALDGDGYRFKDLDGNNGSELISVDNSFLYAFDCYACSAAPTQIHKLVGAALKDVTREPQYQPFLRFKLRQLEADATKDGDRWGSNGFLGGWVASKALVGELSGAWQTMLARYDRKSDFEMEECLTGAEPDKCPPDKLRKLSFPQALAKHLLAHGYITSNQLQQLQVPSP